MDRPELWNWYLSDFPKKTRIRRGKEVEIPPQWQGHIPMYPGTLERREAKKATKRQNRRRDKLNLKKQSQNVVEDDLGVEEDLG